MAAGYVYSLKDNIPYGQHAQNNRYIAEMSRQGTNASKSGAKIIAMAQTKSEKMMSDSIYQANKAQEQRLFEIKSTIGDQTRVLDMRMKDSFSEVTNELQHISMGMSGVKESVLLVGEGLHNLISEFKADFDMGMTSILSQFELQRAELKEGIENLVNTLKNRRKIEAYELFNDAKIEFEKFLQFPEEKQFLNDTLEYLNKSIDIYKGNPYAYLYLGHAYKEHSANIDPILSLENYKTCATYAKGIQDDNLTAFGYFLAGWMSYVSNNVKQAIELTLLSLQYDKQSYPEAYYNLAKYYAFRGDAKNSLKYLDIAIKKFDAHYSNKPSFDSDFKEINTELSNYFEDIRNAERNELDSRLRMFNLKRNE